jgi:uncharacterized damage-inducible protein DinB
MAETDPKATLVRYLQQARDAMLWKLDGLGEYDIRRPATPTGTNLLGLVKHLAGVESEYFGVVFGRPFAGTLPWDPADPDTEQTVDMWATAQESREYITGLYREVWAHADATIAALPLDAPGHVPWWPTPPNPVTLHLILVHVVAEVQRHAGQADIIRELADGAVGVRPSNSNMPDYDAAYWEKHRGRIEQAAREAAGPAR